MEAAENFRSKCPANYFSAFVEPTYLVYYQASLFEILDLGQTSEKSFNDLSGRHSAPSELKEPLGRIYSLPLP
jgi:hypothetical protein